MRGTGLAGAIVAVALCVLGGAASAQVEPPARGSRFMRFNQPEGAPPQTESEGPPVPGDIEPQGTSTAEALIRARIWAQGNGPTGGLSLAEGARAWCPGPKCPLIDELEKLLVAHDYARANAAIASLRKRVNLEIADACDRGAGQAMLNQLECEANPEGWAGHDPYYCVTRTDDPAGPKAGSTGVCTDKACDDPRLLDSVRGTFRWAVCRANKLPRDGRSPRIHFALEMRACAEGVPSYDPVTLNNVAVTLFRDRTVIDGYTQPGAAPGNIMVPREPSQLPTLTGRLLPLVGTELTPTLSIVGSDTVIAGLEIRDNPGEAAVAIYARGPRGSGCELGGRRNWLRGNVFTGNGRAAVFVSGLSLPVGKKGALLDLTGTVIGMRADKPDPTDLNVFRGRQANGIYMGRGRDIATAKRFAWVRGTEIRGNWFVSDPSQLAMGIVADETAEDLIECNRFDDVGAAIVIRQGNKAVIRRNLIGGGRVGVKLVSGASGVVVGDTGTASKALRPYCVVPEGGNRIVRSNEGVEIDGYVSEVLVVGNDISGSEASAVSVHGDRTGKVAERVRIEGNELRESQAGVTVKGGEPVVVGNRISGSTGFAVVVSGTELAAVNRAKLVRPWIGSERNPNAIEGNRVGGILAIDAEPANVDDLERHNHLEHNEGRPLLHASHLAVQVLREGEWSEPVAGARVSIDAEPAIRPPIATVTDADGWAGPSGFVSSDARTWFLVPDWLAIPPRRLGSATSEIRNPFGDPLWRRQSYRPHLIRVDANGTIAEVRYGWDDEPSQASGATFTTSGICVAGEGDACKGGSLLARVVTIVLPAATPARVPDASGDFPECAVWPLRILPDECRPLGTD